MNDEMSELERMIIEILEDVGGTPLLEIKLRNLVLQAKIDQLKELDKENR